MRGLERPAPSFWKAWKPALSLGSFWRKAGLSVIRAALGQPGGLVRVNRTKVSGLRAPLSPPSAVELLLLTFSSAIS